jgi:predicted nucleic acid-binding protein
VTPRLTTLLKADQATLLKRLFDFVVIPEAVSEELLAFHAQLPGFVRVESVCARNHRLPGTENLGKGEAEAIQLAKEIGADILLTDDRKARAAAVSLDVRCSGLLGLLVLAKQANHLESRYSHDRSPGEAGWPLPVACRQSRSHEDRG